MPFVEVEAQMTSLAEGHMTISAVAEAATGLLGVDITIVSLAMRAPIT
jgi:hypothetical protein